MFYITKYRRKIVGMNLAHAFPEKPNGELRQIEKAFYRHLADYLVETVAVFHMHVRDFDERYRFTNPEVLDKYARSGTNVLLAPGHYGNWEWFSCLILRIKFQCLAIYKEQSSQFTNEMILRSRGKYGLTMLRYHEAYKYLLTYHGNLPVCLFFLADQRPPTNKKVSWIPFLNQTTAAFRGLENLHQKMNGAVLYVHLRKTKRGYYDVTFIPLNCPEEPEPSVDLMLNYFHELEKNILENPSYYLWSHKRWKFIPPVNTSDGYAN